MKKFRSVEVFEQHPARAGARYRIGHDRKFHSKEQLDKNGNPKMMIAADGKTKQKPQEVRLLEATGELVAYRSRPAKNALIMAGNVELEPYGQVTLLGEFTGPREANTISTLVARLNKFVSDPTDKVLTLEDIAEEFQRLNREFSQGIELAVANAG